MNVHSPALQPGAPCLTTETPLSTARETRQGRTGGESLRTESGEALLQGFSGKGLQARVQTLKPDGRALALTLNNRKTWCEGLPGGSVVKNPPAMQETQFNPWVGKIPWRREWQPTPVFLPRKSHGQRSLVGYSPWNCKSLT